MGLNVAVVGLGFGAEFVPIYAAHPGVGRVTVCDRDPDVLAVGQVLGAQHSCRELSDVLADSSIDAVHLVTALPDHAAQAVAVLEAGKHVACTVPMGLTIDDLRSVIAACARTGRRYMMMETALYTREFLHVRELVENGELGSISYARGTHFQDMTGWPSYWEGLPPFHYLTHAVAPILALLQTQATSVRALGAGRLSAAEQARYGNPFALETANLTLRDCDAVADVTRSLSRVARPYTESFSIYGDRRSFEWQQLEEDAPYVFTLGEDSPGRGRPVSVERLRPRSRPELLPAEVAHFTDTSIHQDGGHLSFVQGGGHGGSHPHLVHEFVSALLEDRPPAIDEYVAARITAPGIVAHDSALTGGTVLPVPQFDPPALPESGALVVVQ